ncbi:hypothetical protein HPP92_018990 [Vanilla planifolia]|uniref:Uncharacterized protein n=1 Tax=Vanilla planifolia TaxID=51239 RepID=A0A835UNW6_VANPL|nr:hypothetical protein HPP92_018990 [Vanilla planifolia]
MGASTFSPCTAGGSAIFRKPARAQETKEGSRGGRREVGCLGGGSREAASATGVGEMDYVRRWMSGKALAGVGSSRGGGSLVVVTFGRWMKEEMCVTLDKDSSPPWLLFVSENCHGKRVLLSEFRLSKFRTVGLIGYKNSSFFYLSVISLFSFCLKIDLLQCSLLDFLWMKDGESDEQIVLVSPKQDCEQNQGSDSYETGHAGKIKSFR